MNSKKIIIVEDENIIALDIKKRIECMGHRVSLIVNSGESAINAALSLKPDLILMDVTLKGKVNGIDAGIEIWNRFKIPIIYITAYLDDISILKCRLSRCNFDVIIKPFDQEDFNNKIIHALAA